MHHQKAGKKLGVLPDHRTAMIRNLTLAIMEKDSIRTTVTRAKALRHYADRMVTLAKRGDLNSRRRMIQILGSSQNKVGSSENRVRNAIERVYTELVPRFKDRPGGYTQILRLVDRRPGDNTEVCVIRYIPQETKAAKPTKKVKASAASDKPATEKKKTSAKKESDKPSDKPAKAKSKE
jgi:large subunit ribosomal protein L17